MQSAVSSSKLHLRPNEAAHNLNELIKLHAPRYYWTNSFSDFLIPGLPEDVFGSKVNVQTAFADPDATRLRMVNGYALIYCHNFPLTKAFGSITTALQDFGKFELEKSLKNP
jgi:hypothetical protein